MTLRMDTDRQSRQLVSAARRVSRLGVKTEQIDARVIDASDRANENKGETERLNATIIQLNSRISDLEARVADLEAAIP